MLAHIGNTLHQNKTSGLLLGLMNKQNGVAEVLPSCCGECITLISKLLLHSEYRNLTYSNLASNDIECLFSLHLTIMHLGYEAVDLNFRDNRVSILCIIMLHTPSHGICYIFLRR